MIPLMVDCTSKKVVICGGGEVGARKAAYFAGEADVTIYSRSFSQAIHSLPVKQIQTDIQPIGDEIARIIKGAFLVIAATSDPGLNAVIASVCKDNGVLCNNATHPAGDVTLPAKIQGQQFTIAISTQGASPAVARYIREHLQTSYPYLDQMILLEEGLRHQMKEQQIPETQRREILTNILHDPEVWQALPEGHNKARTIISERYQI